MKRDPDRLVGRTYDVLVVGAGVYGAWAAWDAALRGLSVAVIDRGDFGAATTANNLRVIHGGLRYVQHLDFNRMRESIREQQAALHVAPHLVCPMPCAVPTYGRGRRGRLALGTALRINDFVGRGRNRDAAPGKEIGRSRLVPAARMKELAPDLPDRGLTGGAVWHDAQVLDPERMVLALLEAAAGQGAAVANYMAADALMIERKRVVGARVTDRLTGESFFLRARVTLNLAGPWVDRLLATAGAGRIPALCPLTQAWNVVLRRRLPLQGAVGLYSPRTFTDRDRKLSGTGRLIFFVPWRNVTILGTSHRPFVAERLEENLALDQAEVADLLEEGSGAYPAAELSLEDVAYAFGGHLPGVVDPGTEHVRLLKHPVIRDHGRADGLPGVITGVGVKFTTARLVAEQVVDLAVPQVGKTVDACRTHVTRLPAGDIDDWEDFRADAEAYRPRSIPPISFSHLLENHGLLYEDVVELTRKERHLLDPLADGSPVLQAEVVHAARCEMAVKLMDVVRRRTELGKCGLADEHRVRRAAALMGSELHWDAGRREREIAEVLDAYRPYLCGLARPGSDGT